MVNQNSSTKKEAGDLRRMKPPALTSPLYSPLQLFALIFASSAAGQFYDTHYGAGGVGVVLASIPAAAQWWLKRRYQRRLAEAWKAAVAIEANGITFKRLP